MTDRHAWSNDHLTRIRAAAVGIALAALLVTAPGTVGAIPARPAGAGVPGHPGQVDDGPPAAIEAAVMGPDPTCAGTGGGAAYVTDTGLTVYENVSSVYYGTFPDHRTVRFPTGGSGYRPVNVSAPGSASARFESSGDTLCFGDLDATGSSITINPDGYGRVGVSGRVDSLSIGDVTPDGGTGTDLAYDASGDWTLHLSPSLPGSTTVVATYANGTEMDSEVIGDDGTVALSMASGTRRVSIRGNAAPVASDDEYSASKNGLLDVSAPGVLSNDDDAGGDPLSTTRVSGPSHGTLTLRTDGSFEYDPETDFTGTDSFTYEVRDGAGGVARANVTVHVGNQPPIAVGHAPETVTSGDTVRLDARGSYDPNDDRLTYRWHQRRGPGVSLTNATSPVASFTAPTVDDPTKLVFGVVVSDGEASSTPVAVEVTVEPDEGGDGQGPVDRFDANGDGRIDTGELETAIRAWVSDDLSTDGLRAVISAWVSG